MIKYHAEHIFTALGQPVRRHMIEQLSRVDRLSISQLAKPYKISLPAVLRHTEILQASGLIMRTKVGRTQYCSINPVAFEQALEWLMSQKSFWDGNLERLDKHITRKKT